MNWFTNASAVQLWTVGLCVALTLVIMSLAAIYAYMRKRQPIEEPDDLRHQRTMERLAKLTEITSMPQQKSA
jgi:membrane protein implicated in regulation of membrane protease activity